MLRRAKRGAFLTKHESSEREKRIEWNNVSLISGCSRARFARSPFPLALVVQIQGVERAEEGDRLAQGVLQRVGQIRPTLPRVVEPPQALHEPEPNWQQADQRDDNVHVRERVLPPSLRRAKKVRKRIE